MFLLKWYILQYEMMDGYLLPALIHMSPTLKYAYDVQCDPDDAIVTAESPASAAAMKIIIESIKKK